jgi:3-oxoacyl-[acyl-carrier-protein] synthase-3
MGAQIIGVGGYVPENTVKNEDLASLGYDAEWIRQRTGILERRHAPPGIATSDLAVEAARQCIEHAGVNPHDIDLVLVGTFPLDRLPGSGSLGAACPRPRSPGRVLQLRL